MIQSSADIADIPINIKALMGEATLYESLARRSAGQADQLYREWVAQREAPPTLKLVSPEGSSADSPPTEGPL